MSKNYEIAGKQTPFESEGTGSIRQDTVTTSIVKWCGPYDSLKRRILEYERGATYDGKEILSASLTPEVGGMGTLELHLVEKQAIVPIHSEGCTSDHSEIHFVETKLPLAAHKKFRALNPDAPGANGAASLSKQWRLFLKSPTGIQIQNKYLEDPDDVNSTSKALDAQLTDWAALFNRGIEEYIDYLPVVSRVRTYKYMPSTFGSGLSRKGLPDSAAKLPQGFGDAANWLKTGDDIVQEIGSSSWTRTEEWTWAAEWPDLLYTP